MTAPKWRDCADPDELAAAVAAGVEVEYRQRRDRAQPWRRNCNEHADEFREDIDGLAYRVPTSWTWHPEPPAPDDGVIRHRGPADGVRRVWTCKVGGHVLDLPGGSDLPMRKAVAAAFTELTGQPVEFCFSGWGDDLDESELAVVEDRAPDAEVIRAKGLAASQDIIASTLTEEYLRYLYIDALAGGDGQIIYVPTEAGLPILEAGRGVEPTEPGK